MDDDVNGLIILSCLGTNGDVSTLLIKVIGCVDFDVGVTNRNELAVDEDLVIDKRITRGVISCVV